MTDQFSKRCPECSERLSPEARQCACGWKAGGRKSSSGPAWNHVCTWHSGSLFCKYPVGKFEAGATDGWCVFHRTHGSGQVAARIAEESHSHTPEGYLAAARAFVYGKRLAAAAAPAGNVGAMLPPMRQPGDDEREVA